MGYARHCLHLHLLMTGIMVVMYLIHNPIPTTLSTYIDHSMILPGSVPWFLLALLHDNQQCHIDFSNIAEKYPAQRMGISHL